MGNEGSRWNDFVAGDLVEEFKEDGGDAMVVVSSCFGVKRGDDRVWVVFLTLA